MSGIRKPAFGVFVSLALLCCGALEATAIAAPAATGHGYLLRLSRGKAHVTAVGERCGLEVWTNTASGLVTLIQKATDGSDCGVPRVISYRCEPGPEARCRRCLTEQNLCDARFDEADRFQACAGGDFIAHGTRYTVFPVDPARLAAACEGLPAGS